MPCWWRIDCQTLTVSLKKSVHDSFWDRSSIFDLLTFALMWFVFAANTPEQQTYSNLIWFVVGLLHRTLIIYIWFVLLKFHLFKIVQRHHLLVLIVIMCVGIFLPMGPLAGLFKIRSFTFELFLLFYQLILIAYMLWYTMYDWSKCISIDYGWQ